MFELKEAIFNEIQFPDTPFNLKENCIMLGRRGSEAHGTYIKPEDPNGIDDRDLLGLVIPPRNFYLGLKDWTHAEAIKGVWDVVLYEFRKFIGLLMKQNPNVLSMLWLDESDYLYQNSQFFMLKEHRDLFRCKDLAYKCIAGYAYSQLKRMTHYDIDASRTGRYMGAKRKALVEKYAYDVKNAAHLIRLLNMGNEYLETGKMQVKRTHDRELIIDIKKGKYTLDEVQNMAQSKFERLDYAQSHSLLPETMDEKAIEDLTIKILEWRLLN